MVAVQRAGLGTEFERHTRQALDELAAGDNEAFRLHELPVQTMAIWLRDSMLAGTLDGTVVVVMVCAYTHRYRVHVWMPRVCCVHAACTPSRPQASAGRRLSPR